MGVKTSGETMQSFNNSSRRCAHTSAIFSPPGCALPKLGVSREAIVFTTRYVRQWGAKAEHTVGIGAGEYSDDTQLLLATTRSLLYGEQWAKYLSHYELPLWLLYERGGGGATKRAAAAWQRNVTPWGEENAKEHA